MTRASILQGAERRRVAAELAEKYKAGATIKAIAEEVGRSYGNVHQLLVEAEVDFRLSGGHQARGGRIRKASA
ncbi:helix-turn-helix domain-containing protein [Streptomyces sp. NPDC059340]|uniref:helix-turn-helix domain-containing protein n=1 Tax=Streptomyces sp. NPDC059340 TaxID=3346806 RepID=UPI00368F451F